MGEEQRGRGVGGAEVRGGIRSEVKRDISGLSGVGGQEGGEQRQMKKRWGGRKKGAGSISAVAPSVASAARGGQRLGFHLAVFLMRVFGSRHRQRVMETATF